MVTLARKTHARNRLSAQMTPEASLSIVAHRVWVSVNLELANATGHSDPSSDHWKRQQPTATPLASTDRPNSFLKSIVYSFTAFIRPSFRLSKARYWSGPHCTSVGMLACVSLVRGIAVAARTWTKLRK